MAVISTQLKGRTMLVIGKILQEWHHCYHQVLTWYHAADILTQYGVLIIFLVILFLLSTLFLLSRMLK